jgi:hypothetical protein
MSANAAAQGAGTAATPLWRLPCSGMFDVTRSTPKTFGASSDHLIRLEQDRLRDGEADQLRRCLVDYQLEFFGLFDRYVCGFHTLQNSLDEARGLVPDLQKVCPVRDERPR